MTEQDIGKYFERYERFFTKALSGDVDADEISSLYATEFIAASPAGVMTGKNDDTLKDVMAKGYEYYRQIGTKAMHVRAVKVSPIDELHCVAHVSWTATYAKKDSDSDIVIDFEVHYLMQQIGKSPQVFGWVSGDEQELLKKSGAI